MCEKTYTNPLENTLISKYIFYIKKNSVILCLEQEGMLIDK